MLIAASNVIELLTGGLLMAKKASISGYMRYLRKIRTTTAFSVKAFLQVNLLHLRLSMAL